MNKELSPIFDDDGTEVDRDVYWGQKELAAALGTTAPYVGDLMRLIGLLRHESKDPTAEALRSGSAKYVTVDTANGPHRYPRWRKDLVLGVLGHALQEHPKPATRTSEGSRARREPEDPAQSLEARIIELERRVKSLERRLRQLN